MVDVEVAVRLGLGRPTEGVARPALLVLATFSSPGSDADPQVKPVSRRHSHGSAAGFPRQSEVREAAWESFSLPGFPGNRVQNTARSWDFPTAGCRGLHVRQPTEARRPRAPLGADC